MFREGSFMHFLLTDGLCCSLVIVLILLFLIYAIWNCFRQKKASNDALKAYMHAEELKKELEVSERKQEEEDKKAVSLYKRAFKEKGIRNYDGISNEEKEWLILIARFLEIPKSEIRQYFYKGKRITQEKLKEKELRQYHKVRKDAVEIVGYKKYTNLLELEINIANNRKTLASVQYKLAESTTHERANSSDWAFWGGLADGIAGPAAGLAVAADVQRRNIQEKEAVARRKAAAYETMAEAKKNMMNQSVEQNKLVREVEAIKSKLIDIGDDKNKIKMLDFTFGNTKVLESGNLEVELIICEKEEILLLNKPATLDGSLRVCVYKGDTYIGDGYYCAPGFNEWPPIGFYNTYSKQIKGRILCIPKKGIEFDEKVQYRYEVCPVNLWIIEK